MAAEGPHIRHRSITWILWSAGALCLLGAIGLVLWVKLPQWEPRGVVLYAPFIDPVLRAAAVEEPFLHPESGFSAADPLIARMAAWGPDALPSLMQALDAGSPTHRSAALCGIGAIVERHPSAPVEIGPICRLATGDADVVVRVWAFLALKTLHVPELHVVRRNGMADAEPLVRRAVLFGLDPHSDDRDLDLLLQGLRDGDSVVRSIAVIRSLKLGERRAIPALIRLVNDDPEPGVRTFTLDALRTMKATEALPMLRELVMRPGGKLSGRAVAVAYEIAPQGVTDLLIEALDCANRNARLYAADKLGDLKDPRAIPALLAMVADQDAMPAGMAIIALGKIGDGAAIEPVLARLADLAEFKSLRQREHDRDHIPMSVRLSLEFDFAKMVEVVDALPMSAEQRARWQALQPK